MGRPSSPVASSMEPPTTPASAASRIISAAARGSWAYPLSRSAFTGRSVASEITRQLASTSARLTALAPSTWPSMFERPRLVVASASKPRLASRRAVPASQGLGMMNARARSWRARNVAAFCACVGITDLGGLSPARMIAYHPGTMKLGVYLNAQHPVGDDPARRFAETLEQARMIRALGFDSIWGGEHHATPGFHYFPLLPMLQRLTAEAEG